MESFLTLEAPKDSHVFIDYELGEGVTGFEVGEHLYQLGYENLYLATGFSDLDLPPYFKAKVSKKPAL